MKTPTSAQDLLEQALPLHRSGKRAEAEVLYLRALEQDAKHERALFSLSVLLYEQGRVEESSRYLERLVAVKPGEPKYLTNLGEAYRSLGKLDVAAEAFARVLETTPDFPGALQNLAITLLDAGLYGEALPLLQRAVEHSPDNPHLRVVLAWLLLQLHRVEESVTQATRAIELSPTLGRAHNQLGHALDARGDKAGAMGSYRRAVELNPSDYGAHSSLITEMLTSPEYDAASIFAETRAWARLHAEPLRAYIRPHTNDRTVERTLRVGYVSPDFRAHPMQQFLVPLLEHHDPASVEVFLYSSVERHDSETQWYRDFVGERFREIRHLDDVRAAELVRRDAIDVLVDLALHSTGGRLRLFACRPAPVQVTWLGYAGTTGLDSIDYRITDPFLDPTGADLGVYSEACLHLPETSWCYASLNSDLEAGPLPALAAGHVLFGCQNSYRKLHPALFTLWARVLRQVPGSRLFLHAEEHAHDHVRRIFDSSGVAPERLEFGGRVSRHEYLARYRRIDIGLDPYPFNGATTTLDAAWMGVPVVTLRGATCLQRAGTCIAMNLGLPELVASSEDEFVEKAACLAGDLTRLSALRAELRSRLQSSPLGDAPRFARHLEAAYRSAWLRYCAKA